MKLKQIVRIADAVTDLLSIAAAVLLVFMTLAVTYEVIVRYFLSSPTTWVIEVSEICILFITFLGMAWLLKEDGHVRVDFVLIQLKVRTQALMNIVTSILGAAVALALFWYGARVSWDVYVRNYNQVAVLTIPYVYIISVIPLGSFMLFIQFLKRANGYLKTWRGIQTSG